MWDLETLPRLDREFYARSALHVAPDLLGCTFAKREQDGSLCAGIIVETEAYTGDDPACHAFRGESPRCRVMFGEPGNAYVYFTYGMHFCFNVVTSLPGCGEAVLVRAVEPCVGATIMATRRGTAVTPSRRQQPNFLCGGPARLCQAFGIDLSFNGASLLGETPIVIYGRPPNYTPNVSATARIGISRAKEQLWRFVVTNSRYLSR